MKPGLSLHIVTLLPKSLSAKVQNLSKKSALTSGELTTSSNGRYLGGLKKCVIKNLDDKSVVISVINSERGIVDVLDDNIVSLPIFNNPDLEIPPIVQVELIEISEELQEIITNIIYEEFAEEFIMEEPEIMEEIELVSQEMVIEIIEEIQESLPEPAMEEEIKIAQAPEVIEEMEMAEEATEIIEEIFEEELPMIVENEETIEEEKPNEEVTEEKLLDEIANLNVDKDIDGFIVQLPLPKHIDEQKILMAIAPNKDVDGFHPTNVGKMALNLPTFISATPFGILELLERYNV